MNLRPGCIASPKLWIALDVPTQDEAEWWMNQFPQHRHYKVGMELFYHIGPQILHQWIQDKGLSLFLDLKLHDIPRTVAQAIKQLDDIGVVMTTIHLSGGRDMCHAAVQARRHVSIVGVSVLTSLGDHDLKDVGLTWPTKESVNRLVGIGQQSGLDGVVVSGQELSGLARQWPGGRFVVPGIRREGDAENDQKRVVSPQWALSQGATDLVIGRTLLKAEQPRVVYQELMHLL